MPLCGALHVSMCACECEWYQSNAACARVCMYGCVCVSIWWISLYWRCTCAWHTQSTCLASNKNPLFVWICQNIHFGIVFISFLLVLFFKRSFFVGRADESIDSRVVWCRKRFILSQFGWRKTDISACDEFRDMWQFSRPFWIRTLCCTWNNIRTSV